MMTNNLRNKMDRIETLANVIDAIVDKMQSDTMQFKRVETVDDEGNTSVDYVYVEYDSETWGAEYCEKANAKKRVYEEAIKAIEKLAEK